MKPFITKISVGLGMILSLSSCTQTVPFKPSSAAEYSKSRVFDRNYEKGRRTEAFVGQPVVSFKDYVATKRSGANLRSDIDFRVSYSISPWFPVAKGQDLLVAGTLNLGGTEYTAVAFHKPLPSSTFVLLVAPDGRLYEHQASIDSGSFQLFKPKAKYDPPGAILTPSAPESIVDVSAPFMNFQLLYGGTDGRSFTLTYREYTPQDLIKPGFTQTLTYEINAKTVRYRNTRIEIHEVTSEKLAYTVLADESGDSPTKVPAP